LRKPGEEHHRFVWHDRKAWWQQEQGILAYLILAGVRGNAEYRRLARESAAFYNAWFLDNDSGGVYFNVLANGIPYLLGTERDKGSHSMAGYHSFELAYLAAVYTNLLITKEPMDFYFKPAPGGFTDNVLRVQPDILPPGSVRIGAVWVNDGKYTDFDAEALTVKLPSNHGELKVRVRLVPAGVSFSADLLEVSQGSAKLALAGSLERGALKYFEEQMESVLASEVQKLILMAEELDSISGEALRYLAFAKQKQGAKFDITIAGAKKNIKEVIERSELSEEFALV
jgi:hypothetical protein